MYTETKHKDNYRPDSPLAKFPAVVFYMQKVFIYLYYFGRSGAVVKGLIARTLKKIIQLNKPTCCHNGHGGVSLLVLPPVNLALTWEEGEEASGHLLWEGLQEQL